MVGMLLVLVAIVVVAVLAALVFLGLRPRGGDLDSVRSYHSALGTIEHLSDRSGGSHVNVVQSAGGQAESRVRPHSSRDGDGTQVPPIPVRGNDEFPEPGTPLVFDDARPADGHPNQAPSGGAAGSSGADRAHRHALESMNHRPRRITAVALTVVVLVIFAALAYTGSKHSPPGRHADGSSSSSAASSATHATGASASAASHTTQGKHAVVHHRKDESTSTTSTVPSRIVATSTSGATTTYPVVTSSYRLSITASGLCWTLVRSATSGATLWTGTLQPGASQVINATGATTLELGAPSVLVTINKVPVVFPVPFRTPFEAIFQPVTPAVSGAASASSTTTTTSTTTTGPAGSTP